MKNDHPMQLSVFLWYCFSCPPITKTIYSHCLYKSSTFHLYVVSPFSAQSHYPRHVFPFLCLYMPHLEGNRLICFFLDDFLNKNTRKRIDVSLTLFCNFISFYFVDKVLYTTLGWSLYMASTLLDIQYRYFTSIPLSWVSDLPMVTCEM